MYVNGQSDVSGAGRRADDDWLVAAAFFVSVLIGDAIVLFGGFGLLIAIGLQGWGDDGSQLHAIAAQQQGQMLALTAGVCALLALLGVLSWRKRAVLATVLQAVLIVAVVMFASVMSAGFPGQQQQNTPPQPVQPGNPIHPGNQGSYCSGGRCWGPESTTGAYS